uniref:Uncharacterized protein n=1 Tax=Lepeophtheirus salmonis TaxID=72036 RepID=A0A0K2TPF7_LEPSM
MILVVVFDCDSSGKDICASFVLHTFIYINI